MQSISRKKTFASAIALVGCLISNVRADDELARDMSNLKQLLGGIQKVLPEGWRAELTPDVPETIACEFRQPTTPSIMIWREDKAVGRYVGLKLAPGSTDAEFQPMRVFFQMSMMNMIRPQQYREAAEKNATNDRLRREFQKKLQDAGVKNTLINLLTADEPPVPPASYKPKSPEQKELVRQYGLLWAETEPMPLPTHYYKTLAFNADFDDHFNLQDGDIDSERQEIKKAILKLLTPYGGQ
jgi:hypothetical protein